MIKANRLIIYKNKVEKGLNSNYYLKIFGRYDLNDYSCLELIKKGAK